MAEARDRYVFIKKLAEGGMADVFLARDAQSTPPRLCVVKQLLPHLRSKRDHVAMFLDEADLAMNLAHPSVVRAFDRGTGKDGPFLVLEYLAGFDLDLVLERLRSVGAQLPWPLAVQIIIASAEGMAYAHALKGADGKPLNLIHRDLTPSNIFLTFDGVVKVLDFGIARAEERRTRTSTGMLKGKARYLAPELIQQLPGDARVDQFSLGAALYESLTLQPLFAGDNELSVIHAIVEGRRPDLKEQRADVPDEVEAVFKRMTATLREERFSSMSEVAAALREVLSPDDHRPALAAFVRQHFGPDFMAHASLMGRLASASTAELRSYFEKGINLATLPEDPSRQLKTVVAIGQPIPLEARRTPPSTGPGVLELPDDAPLGLPQGAPLSLPDDGDAPPPLMSGRPSEPPQSPPPTSTTWMMAVGAAVLLLVVGGVWWKVKHRAVPVARGTLLVRSQPPGATIEVDGVAVQFRTPAALSDLAPGPHALVFKHSDYQPAAVTAQVVAGQQQTLDVVLTTREGQLVLSVSPSYAVVTIDGQEVRLDGGAGHSPPQPEGAHLLEVRAVGYRTHVESFGIKDGDRLPIDVVLEYDPAMQ